MLTPRQLLPDEYLLRTLLTWRDLSDCVARERCAALRIAARVSSRCRGQKPSAVCSTLARALAVAATHSAVHI